MVARVPFGSQAVQHRHQRLRQRLGLRPLADAGRRAPAGDDSAQSTQVVARGRLVVVLNADEPGGFAEAADFQDAVAGQEQESVGEMSMDDAGLMRRCQPLSGLREQAMADARGGGERGPISRRQARQPFLQRRRPTRQFQHLQRVRQVWIVEPRLSEALAEFIRFERVSHVRFRELPQHRFGAAAWIEDVVDRFVGAVAQSIDDADRPEHQALDIAGLDQRELIERDDAASKEDLAQRAALPTRLGEKGGQRVGIDELGLAQYLPKLLVALIDGSGKRQDAATSRHNAILVGLACCLLTAVCCLLPVRWFGVERERIRNQRNASQFAQLAAIPFAHLDEMAIDLLAAIGDLALLLLQFFGVLGKPLRFGFDAAGLFIDLSLPAFQARLIARE